jgi:hypothetical protein
MPLSSLIEQSGDAIDVNFIACNNFNNNAYRGNYRPFPIIIFQTILVVPLGTLLTIIIGTPLIMKIA